MPGPLHREPYEIQFAQLAVTLLDLLARDMDDTFCNLIHRAGSNRHSPHRQTAEAAEQVVAACSRLSDAIRRYQLRDALSRLHEDQEREESPIPF